MALPFDKILAIGIQYGSEYLDAYASTMLSPASYYYPVYLPDRGSILSGAPRREYLSPKLLVFVLLSIFIGLTLNAIVFKSPVIPYSEYVSTLAAVPLILLFYWFFCAVFLTVACRLLGGKGSFIESVGILLQIFSMLYVAIGLLGISIFALITSAEMLGVQTPIVIDFYHLPRDPRILSIGSVMMVSYTIMLLFYVPIGLRWVHRLGVFRSVLISIPSGIGGFVLGMSLYGTFGYFIPGG